MKRLLGPAWKLLASRSVTPLVICFFLLIYIVIAFWTDETLTVLMDLTRGSILLSLVLALLPLNIAARLVRESRDYLQQRRALAGNPELARAELYDESVELPGSPALPRLKTRLDDRGYATRAGDGVLAAWRGVSTFPARFLYLVGVLCLFGGILVSLTMRDSFRGNVVEREPLPAPSGDGDVVSSISLGKGTGLILSKELVIETTPAEPGAPKHRYGLYPPGNYGGAFVYPRYLGIGLYFKFSAPDLAKPYESHSILAIYPPGKEAAGEIPDSPYKIIFSLAQPEDGSDPYVTGRLSFTFKLLKGKDQVSAGTVPAGGEFVRDGYRLAFPDARRVIVTDFIKDRGVVPIWLSSLFFIASFCAWLVLRFFLPRREMLFAQEGGSLHAYSRAEGKERSHREVFHEALDYLAEGKDTHAPELPA